MKLNNQQIYALTEQIYNRLEDSKKYTIKKYKESEDLKLSLEDTLEKLRPVIGCLENDLIFKVVLETNYGVSLYKNDYKTVLEQKIINDFARNLKYVDKNSIKNEIILATIGDFDLESLTNHVISKFN